MKTESGLLYSIIRSIFGDKLTRCRFKKKHIHIPKKNKLVEIANYCVRVRFLSHFFSIWILRIVEKIIWVNNFRLNAILFIDFENKRRQFSNGGLGASIGVIADITATIDC